MLDPEVVAASNTNIAGQLHLLLSSSTPSSSRPGNVELKRLSRNDMDHVLHGLPIFPHLALAPSANRKGFPNPAERGNQEEGWIECPEPD